MSLKRKNADGTWTECAGTNVDVDNVTIGINSDKLEVKDGGLEVVKIKSDALSTSIPASGTVDTKLTTEKAVGDYALPFTGGTLTGKLVCNNTSGTDIEGGSADALSIAGGNDTESVTITGGTTTTSGASLVLYGKDNTTNAGGFVLSANNGTTTKYSLKGGTDNILQWNGRQVACTARKVGNILNPSEAVGAPSLSGMWIMNIMGNVAIFTVASGTEQKVRIWGIEMASWNDTFYLGEYKMQVTNITGSLSEPPFFLSVAVLERTVGEFLQMSLTGL